MVYGIKDLSKNLLGLKPDTRTLRKDEFWALNEISFDLKRGETLGIIGVNGSGKSTLLRLLSGIFPPDKGEIRVNGKIGALVAVGAGFHPHMTGRENIYLNGAILGMARQEIDSKFGDIINFAEIDDFLDAPVSAYSSGMRVRLGFAIAIHCQPDILLVDEVLSVGDLSFRNKSLRYMSEYRQQANAVIFVSHNLEQVRQLCSRLIIMDQGRITYTGNVYQGLIVYNENMRAKQLQTLKQQESVRKDERLNIHISSGEEITLLDFGILDAAGQSTEQIGMTDPLLIYWDFSINKQEIEGLYFAATVFVENYERGCIHLWSNDNQKATFNTLKKGRYRLKIEIPEHHLMPNIYLPQLSIRNDLTGETYERLFAKEAFRVVSDGTVLGRGGIVAVQEQWHLTRLEEKQEL